MSPLFKALTSQRTAKKRARDGEVESFAARALIYEQPDARYFAIGVS